VKVTNLWPNRLIGDEQLPEDREWDGIKLKEWPKWVLEGSRADGPLHLHHVAPLDQGRRAAAVGPLRARAGADRQDGRAEVGEADYSGLL
jgi:hypothetical protein